MNLILTWNSSNIDNSAIFLALLEKVLDTHVPTFFTSGLVDSELQFHFHVVEVIGTTIQLNF